MSEKLHGIIIRGLGGLYDIKSDEGSLLSCRARGHLRHDNITPLVGDRVEIELDDEGNYALASIEPRKNELIRPPLANLDYIFIAAASSHPAPALDTMDKLIAIAEHSEIFPVIIITKSDLNSTEAEYISDIYRRSGFDVFITGKGSELDALHSFVASIPSGSLTAFAGVSGVGKSTLMNSLFPELELVTGGLSQKTERGRHTTRHVQLYPCGNIYIADTPGFSMIDFIHFDFFDKEDLPFNFREFLPYLGKCRYSRCTHTKEEGCLIIKAVADGIIPRERHESYCAIYDDLKNKHEWNKK